MCHSELFRKAGLTAVWSEETDGNYCCLVRGNAETGTVISILEESPAHTPVTFCIFEGWFGEKRQATHKDRSKRKKNVMPKGRKEAYRDDCNGRPEVFRAGLEKFTTCVFTVEHGAMQKHPTKVLKGLKYMFDRVIKHQCDIVCGDGNQATSTVLKSQEQADFQNSMISTVAKASFGAFNQGKWMREKSGL